MKKWFLLISCSIVFLVGFGTLQVINFSDGKLHIIFCDVGQGDGILLKTPGGSYMLIDSGPDAKILSCLSRHMPFWKHDITMALLTHPHQDHLAGFAKVFQSYSVSQFITERVANKTIGYKNLMSTVEHSGAQKIIALAGDTYASQQVHLKFVGPTETFLQDTSPHGFIGESGEFGSLETMVEYGSFRALLTGDSQAIELQQALSLINGKINLLQIPHHGSKTGLSDEVLSALMPQLGVVSVGAHNKYGHPAQITLTLLEKYKIPVLRTDQKGDIEIISDGKNMEVN